MRRHPASLISHFLIQQTSGIWEDLLGPRAAGLEESGLLPLEGSSSPVCSQATVVRPVLLPQAPDTDRVKTHPSFPNKSKDAVSSTPPGHAAPLQMKATLSAARLQQEWGSRDSAQRGDLGATRTALALQRVPVQKAADVTAAAGHRARKCTPCR